MLRARALTGQDIVHLLCAQRTDRIVCKSGYNTIATAWLIACCRNAGVRSIICYRHLLFAAVPSLFLLLLVITLGFSFRNPQLLHFMGSPKFLGEYVIQVVPMGVHSRICLSFGKKKSSPPPHRVNKVLRKVLVAGLSATQKEATSPVAATVESWGSSWKDCAQRRCHVPGALGSALTKVRPIPEVFRCES